MIPPCPIEGSLSLSSPDDRSLSWETTAPIGLVIVKAGNGANLFTYDPPRTADRDLPSVEGPQGNILAISHVDFCGNPAQNTPTATSEPTATEEPSATPEPTATDEPTATEEPSVTPEPTATDEPTLEPTATDEPTVTSEPSATPEPTDSPPTLTGCTYSQGYWKNHSSGRRYNPVWASVGGPDAAFYLSEQPYIDVLWQPPRGNVYYIVAKQFIAAQLNVANGADTPANVAAALSEAEAFFNTTTPTEANSADRDSLLAAADLLDRFNNGQAGPPHCED